MYVTYSYNNKLTNQKLYFLKKSVYLPQKCKEENNLQKRIMQKLNMLNLIAEFNC